MVVVACSYNMNHSAAGKILKNKDTIMEHVKSSFANDVDDNIRGLERSGQMEKLFSAQMQGQHQSPVPTQLNADSREN